MGGKVVRGWLPAEKATVTRERVKECAFQWEGGKKTSPRGTNAERGEFFFSLPNKGLDDEVIDIQQNALISSYKIMHLTSISKLTIHAFFLLCVPVCGSLSVYVCAAAGHTQ